MTDSKELEGKVCHYAVWRTANDWRHCENTVRSIVRGKPCCAIHTPKRLRERERKWREHREWERKWYAARKRHERITRQLLEQIYIGQVSVIERGDLPEGWAMSVAADVLRRANPRIDQAAYEIDKARMIKWIEETLEQYGPDEKAGRS